MGVKPRSSPVLSLLPETPSITSFTTADQTLKKEKLSLNPKIPVKVSSSQSPVLSFSIKVLESVANAACLQLLTPIYFPFHCNLPTLVSLPVIS